MPQDVTTIGEGAEAANDARSEWIDQNASAPPEVSVENLGTDGADTGESGAADAGDQPFDQKEFFANLQHVLQQQAASAAAQAQPAGEEGAGDPSVAEMSPFHEGFAFSDDLVAALPEDMRESLGTVAGEILAQVRTAMQEEASGFQGRTVQAAMAQMAEVTAAESQIKADPIVANSRHLGGAIKRVNEHPQAKGLSLAQKVPFIMKLVRAAEDSAGATGKGNGQDPNASGARIPAPSGGAKKPSLAARVISGGRGMG